MSANGDDETHGGRGPYGICCVASESCVVACQEHTSGHGSARLNGSNGSILAVILALVFRSHV